jgi:PRTRC genetic system protein C
MTQDHTTTAPTRRIFIYGEHRFDDPGAEYTVEHVKNHLQVYFPELAHATTEEKTLADGTVEISFRKQVARKGSGDADRLAPSASSELALNTVKGLALLLSELAAVPPYEDPLAELTATLGREPLTLAAILDARDTLQTHADQVFGLAGRTAQVVKRCLELPSSPAHGVPLGF